MALSAPLLEIIAHERLLPALRSAFHYVLAVAAQRHPRLLLKLHGLREELFAGLSCALEAHALLRHGASFSEHFYFLRRHPAASNHRKGGWMDGLCDRLEALPIRARLLLEIIILVLPGYLRAKLDPLLSVDVNQDGWLLNGGGDGGAPEGSLDVAIPVARPVRGASATGSVERAHRENEVGGSGTMDPRRRLLSLTYRGMCALLDAAHLAHLLYFLTGRSPYASVSQRVLRYCLLPAPSSELSGPGLAPPAGASRRERAMFFLELPLQHARQLLLLSAFGYRLLAWLHTPRSAPLIAAPFVPPPPAPYPPRRGKLLPAAGACAECALCPMEEPTASPSGYVFCSRCITRAVMRDGRCPVTDMPVTLPELLRLYETSRPA